MEPLAAFQGLVLAMAAATAVEGFRPSNSFWTRVLFWVIFAILALIGITTTWIAESWPTASAAMVWLGSSPITFFVAFVGWIAFLQKPWRWRARTVSSDAATASPLPVLGHTLADRVAEIEKSLDRLEHNHGNLRDRSIAFEAAIGGLQKKLLLLYDALADQKRAALLNDIVGRVEQLHAANEALQGVEPLPIGRERGMEDHVRISHVVQRMEELTRDMEIAGLDVRDFQARLDGERQRVVGDALYARLNDAEKERFSSVEVKRAWIINGYAIRVMRAMVQQRAKAATVDNKAFLKLRRDLELKEETAGGRQAGG